MEAGRERRILSSSHAELSDEMLSAIRKEVSQQLAGSFGKEVAMLRQQIATIEAQLRNPSRNETIEASAVATAQPRVEGWCWSRAKVPRCWDRSTDQYGMELKRRGADGYAMYRPVENDEEQKVRKFVVGTAEQGQPMPPSLFGYGMGILATSPTPWHERAIWQMLIGALVQQFLVLGFSQVNYNNVLQSHWKSPSKRGFNVYDCASRDRIFLGVPAFYLVVCTVAIYLVCLIIDAHTRIFFSVRHPTRGNGIVLFVYARTLWFMLAIFLPGIFAVEVAALFADSQDIVSVIMNTLAVTFILDVDTMLYEALLTEEEKETYQDLCSQQPSGHELTSETKQWASIVLSVGNFFVMFFHFCGICFYDDWSGLQFFAHMKQLWTIYFFSIGFRGAVHFIIRFCDVDASIFLRCFYASAAFVVFAVAGPLWFFGFQVFSSGASYQSNIIVCLNQSVASG